MTSARPLIDRVQQALSKLGASKAPIIVGPWLGEIGFELLYWIPFLRWAVRAGHLDPDQLWVVSRGGCRSWYADLSPHYLDLFDLYTPAEFRAKNDARAEQQRLRTVRRLKTAKQGGISGFDREILAAVAQRAGLAGARALHPSQMYGLFRPFWRRHMEDPSDGCTKMQAMQAPPRLPGLPPRYVAVKFYSSQACSEAGNRQYVRRILRALLETTPVVLLHTGTQFDEHGEFPIEDHPRLYRLTTSPATNLETQTAAIAGASAFVGTYGGFAYLAPLLGIPTTALYATRNFREDHLRRASSVFGKMGVGFRVMELAEGAGSVERSWTHAA